MYKRQPWNNAALLQRIETALELTAAPKEVPEEQTTALNRSHIRGKSKGLMEVLKDVYKRQGVYGTVFLRYVYGVFILVACYIDVAEFGSSQVIIGISFLYVPVGIYHRCV